MKRLFLALLAVSIVSFALFLLFMRDSYLYDGALHLGMLSFALYFLWQKDLPTTLKAMGFPGSLKSNVLYTVGGLLAVFMLVFLLSVAAMLFGFNDQAKVTQKIADLPLYVLAMAVIFAPISEELLFRALLVPRIGIVFSSLVFGGLHLAYGSVVEVVGVAMVGLVLALVFRFSKSITPCILIHLIYNFLSIAAMRLFA
ncbi:MAG: type II CAAX endopeptidase family protein [Candidatus ainarchaeum sp.]|nr:type II CAAX endopeptidase family protein [Candidatus ainarchaeum sp.]